MTDAFTLDTSGTVKAYHWRPLTGRRQWIRWTDLDAFTQGYVEALFASLIESRWGNLTGAFGTDLIAQAAWLAFSDLAPETLARIMEDCARRQAERPRLGSVKDGADHWQAQQRGTWEVSYPPLTPYLGDDGKVYLREGGQ